MRTPLGNDALAPLDECAKNYLRCRAGPVGQAEADVQARTILAGRGPARGVNAECFSARLKVVPFPGLIWRGLVCKKKKLRDAGPLWRLSVRQGSGTLAKQLQTMPGRHWCQRTAVT
jgi:hypothetical protein